MVLGDIPVPAWILGVILFCSLNVLIIGILVYWRTRWKNKSVLFIFLMAIIPPLLLLILSYTMRPVFVSRAFLSAYVGVGGLIGIAASRGKGFEKALIACFITLAAVCTLPYQISFNEFPRSQFLQASTYLQNETNGSDIVLHDNKLSFFPFEVYAPDLNSRFLADLPDSSNDTLADQTQAALGLYALSELPMAINDSNRLFFVVFRQTIAEYANAGGHPVIKKLDVIYGKPVSRQFGDLFVFEYSSPQE
jgi:hypothetical protein